MRKPDISNIPSSSSDVKEKIDPTGVDEAIIATPAKRTQKVVALHPQTTDLTSLDFHESQEFHKKQNNRVSDARARKSNLRTDLEEIAAQAATDFAQDFADDRDLFPFARRVKRLDVTEDELPVLFNLFLDALSESFIHHPDRDQRETSRKYFSNREGLYVQFLYKLSKVRFAEGQTPLEIVYKKALTKPVQLRIAHPQSPLLEILASLCFHLAVDHRFFLSQTAAARLLKQDQLVISEALSLLRSLKVIKRAAQPGNSKATEYWLNDEAFEK